jgi:DNA-binding PadR family transcriptional regulator
MATRTGAKRVKKYVRAHPVTVPAALLHLLEVGGESSAKALKDLLLQRTGDRMTTSWGSVSPALRHLMDEGLVTNVRGAEVTRENRCTYRITALGRRRANENRKIVFGLFTS